MHRNDDSRYFLYIEPTIDQKSTEPVDDIYTEAVEYFLRWSKAGTSNYSNLKCPGSFNEGNGWRGMHCSDDGELSSSRDYLFENGFITNSLCVHYVRWFRSVIEGPNLAKLQTIKELYKTKPK